MTDSITITNAWMNNLKGVQLELRMGQFVVFVGPSGSGKSSLAFDVLYSEADRLGSARGLYRVFRRQEPRYEVKGLPAQTVGIEQQIIEHTMIETAGWGSGFLWEAQGYATIADADKDTCHRCNGRGFVRDIDRTRIARDPSKSVTRGAFTPAVKAVAGLDSHHWEHFCVTHGLAPATPWDRLPTAIQDEILGKDGKDSVLGIVPALRKLLHGNRPMPKALAEEINFYLTNTLCPVCQGFGFSTKAREIIGPKDTLGTLADRGLVVLTGKERQWFNELGLQDIPVRHPIFQMSTSEARRLRFFSCLRGLIRPSLVIFDEPAAGLLSVEALRLAGLFQSISKCGHAVVVVDHTVEIIRAADRVVEFGPGAGVRGGKIININEPKAYFQRQTITLPKKKGVSPLLSSASRKVGIPSKPGRRVRVSRVACNHRLEGMFTSWCGFREFNFAIPLGKLVCISGPSGSGKSVYLRALFAACDKTPQGWQGRASLVERNGSDKVRRPYLITPEAIGKHPGSTPATFIGLWDRIRDFFAQLPKAKHAHLKKSHFSFNTSEGRCPRCLGIGYLPLGDTRFLECPECLGQRLRMHRVADVRHQGRNIADVNGLTVSEGLQLFTREPAITHYLEFLDDAALDYLVLGQPSNTLSGGEAQRIKVAAKLCKRLGDRSVYILDNPFRGIGAQAIPRLYEALRKLVDKNNTVVIAENHGWVASQADWLIALGRPRISNSDRQLISLHQGPPPRDFGGLWSQETTAGIGRV